VIVLVKVKKRSEKFDKAKLKTSLKKAGAKDEHATKVADKISDKVKEGNTTVEIWEWSIAELKPLDPKVAEAYRTYKKPKRSTS
jgi:2-phosphoglycerate kinase